MQSRKEAYEKSETIHWTSRPKTAEEKVPETRERISTAPPNLSSNATNDVKALKVHIDTQTKVTVSPPRAVSCVCFLSKSETPLWTTLFFTAREEQPEGAIREGSNASA